MAPPLFFIFQRKGAQPPLDARPYSITGAGIINALMYIFKLSE
jgi:hypothetical protein